MTQEEESELPPGRFKSGDLAHHVNGTALCRVREVRPSWKAKMLGEDRTSPQVRLDDRIELRLVVDGAASFWDEAKNWEKWDGPDPARLAALETVLYNAFSIMVNMNDTFAYASADAQEIRGFDLPALVQLVRVCGHDAVIAYAAVARGVDPLVNYQTEHYWSAKAAIQAMRAKGDLWFDD